MLKSNIQNKSLSFARNVYRLCKKLEQKREFIISNQLLKSSTSVGANLREGYYAESRSDYIHKLSISLKEINESVDILKSQGAQIILMTNPPRAENTSFWARSDEEDARRQAERG
jgi:four helix bundle protein